MLNQQAKTPFPAEDMAEHSTAEPEEEDNSLWQWLLRRLHS
jgi:hypothetical protein